MTHEWFIVRTGKEHGPFTAQQLKDAAAKGKLAPDDLVRRGDTQTPRKASTIKGLFTPVDPAPAQSSPPPTAQKKGIPSKKALIIASVVGGACLFLCCGGLGVLAIFGHKMSAQFNKELDAADALWESGKKDEAIAVYREKRQSAFLDSSNPRGPVLYGRLIDYEYEKGNAEAGKALIEEADKKKITPAVSHADAKAVVAAKQAERRVAEANKKMAGKSATVKHEPYTQVIMPDLPPECVHDIDWSKPEEKNKKEDYYTPKEPVPVADTSKVDFCRGPNGETMEMDRFYEGKERQQGYYYRNAKGQKVMHGPWKYLKRDGGTETETLYIHGIEKSSYACYGDKPSITEKYRGDNDHWRTEYEYFPSGDVRTVIPYRMVHALGPKGETVSKVLEGTMMEYYDNGLMKRTGQYDKLAGIKKVETYKNGQSVGGAVYTREGKIATSWGAFRP